MAPRTLFATGAVLTALALGTSAATTAAPPVGSCPSPFVTRTLDFFANDPPELVASVNKNGDNILCTRDFPSASGQPGGNVIDNTAAGLQPRVTGPAQEVARYSQLSGAAQRKATPAAAGRSALLSLTDPFTGYRPRGVW